MFLSSSVYYFLISSIFDLFKLKAGKFPFQIFCFCLDGLYFCYVPYTFIFFLSATIEHLYFHWSLCFCYSLNNSLRKCPNLRIIHKNGQNAVIKNPSSLPMQDLIASVQSSLCILITFHPLLDFQSSYFVLPLSISCLVLRSIFVIHLV